MLQNSEIQEKAKQFRKDFKLKELSYEVLSEAIEKQGYTVVEFNSVSNNDNVQSLVDALNLRQNIIFFKGFTYADSNYRIVFINEDLTEEEKLIVLSHEQGHIYLGHLSYTSIIGKDVTEEFEANEFSHYLLNPQITQRAACYIGKNKKSSLLVLISIALIICAIFSIATVYEHNTYYGEYYITTSGTKFHKKDCAFVEGKSGLRRMTRKDYESGKYTPCSVCLHGNEEDIE